MWPDINAGGKIQASVMPSPYSSNELFAKELEDELMKYTASYDGNEVNMCSVEKTEKAHGNAEEEKIVDITDCTRYSGKGKVEAKSPDATESSSSFDHSDSGVENVDASGESEAISGFRGDAASELDSDILEELFRMRQKKLTDHWKTYIQPLAWRCKWTEIQIKKFEEQAQIYDRKLEECQRQKVQLEKSTQEVDGVKSLPWSQNCVRNDVLRRKKRRKIEETEDVAKVLSGHNLFSYYGNSQSLFPKGALWNFSKKNHAKAGQHLNVNDEFRGFDEEASHSRQGNDDSAVEQLYRRIMSLQSHVGKLKNRVNKVTSEKVGEFPYEEYLTLASQSPHHASLGSPSDIDVHPNYVVQMPVDSYVLAQLKSGYNMNAASTFETAFPSHEADVPHVDRNTAQGNFADTSENQQNNLLVYNRRAKGKMDALEEVNPQPTQTPAAQTSTNPSLVAQPNPLIDDEPPLKMRCISHIIAPESKSKKGGPRKGPGQ